MNPARTYIRMNWRTYFVNLPGVSKLCIAGIDFGGSYGVDDDGAGAGGRRRRRRHLGALRMYRRHQQSTAYDKTDRPCAGRRAAVAAGERHQRKAPEAESVY